MATNQGTTPSNISPTPTTPEAHLRSVITDALYDLEWGVVRPLATQVQVEHALLDSNDHPSVRAEIATRRAARVLGTVASIILKIEAAAKQVAVLFLLAVIASAAFAQTAPTCVPFAVESGHIIVQVAVDGHGPYPLILDTGAQRTMFDPYVAKAANIDLLSKVGFHGLGQSGDTARTAFADIAFGGHEVKNVPVLVYDPNAGGKWVGVVGWDYLSRFNVAIDNQHNCLSLQ